MAFVPLPVSQRQNRRARERSGRRAEEVARALHLIAERDPEIDTTYHLRKEGDERGAVLDMGSPIFRVGFFRHAPRDWMILRAKGPSSLPEGARIRPPRRTYFEWREGEPGEAPTMTTPRGTALFIENESSFDVKRFVAWIDSFPKGVWLVVLSREEIELRADEPATADAVAAARLLFELLGKT